MQPAEKKNIHVIWEGVKNRDLKLIKCNINEKFFKDKKIMTRHIKNVHSENSNYVDCTVCGMKFKNYKKLNRHIKKIHVRGNHFR